MDEKMIERALRAGPIGEPTLSPGTFERGLHARESETNVATFRTRLRPTSSIGLSGLAVAAVLVVFVSTMFLLTRTGDVGAIATPTPTGGPSLAPTLSPTLAHGDGAPTELIDRWVGPVRPIPILAQPATRAFLDIQGASMRFDAGPGQPGNLFATAVRQVGINELLLTATTPGVGCNGFDAGTYSWSLSPGATLLTLAPLNDECSARASALAGEWTHTACRDATSDCLGPLEPGSYSSTQFDAFGTGLSGQLAFEVPGQWSNSADKQTNYFLRPTTDYLGDAGFDGGDTVSGIYVWAGTVATGQPDDCGAAPAPGVAATADSIAKHLGSLTGVRAVDRGTVQIGPRSARQLDIAIDPAYTTTCPWTNGEPFRSLIMFSDLGRDGGVWGTSPGTRQRVWFIDLAPERVVSIWIDGPDSRFNELVTGATPIVESMRFQGSARVP